MRIVVDGKVPHIAEALAMFGDVVVHDPADRDDHGALAHAQVLITRSVTRVDRDLLDRAPRLELVGSATAGIDHVDLAALVSRGVAFGHAPGANARAVAEYVVGAVTGAGVPPGAAVAVVGYGHVGRRVAALLRALGFVVRVSDPPLAEQLRRGSSLGAGDMHDMHSTARAERYLSLADAVRDAAVVTLHVPLVVSGRWSTHHLIGSEVLGLAAPRAVIINTSRGGVVDEAALQSNPQIRAVLDVWEHEPEVSWSLIDTLSDRLLLATPHVAGYTVEAKMRCTAAMHAAVAAHLGRGTSWSWIPDPVPGIALAPETTVAQVFDKVVGLAQLDAELRGLRARPAEHRARGFEDLRRVGRHELWAHAHGGGFVGGSPGLHLRLQQLEAALPPEPA